MNLSPQDEMLERVKAEIRADAELARVRDPLPRHDPPPRAAQAQRPSFDEGIERDRLDYTIAELSGAHYRAFIDQAFRALLKRPPDDAGAELQTRLLAAGAAKAEVLGNLRWSPEGKRVGTRVRGLLPRYALAKLVRVPVLGYFLDWGLALAGLPLLLQHQRAADTSNAARFGAAADAQQRSERAIEAAQAAHAALGAEHDRRSDAIRADIGRMLLRLDDLERHAALLEGRTGGLETRTDASAREAIELRHQVNAANHWVASIQASLSELEDLARAERERADALLASIEPDPEESAARSARYADWSAQLAQRLEIAAPVFDLGSADGAWLSALAAHGIHANGAEDNAAWVARAQARGIAITLENPMTALSRLADAQLGGLTLSPAIWAVGTTALASLLAEARRTLKPGGWLLARDLDAAQAAGIPASANTLSARSALLVAAGFLPPTLLPGSGGQALIAQRPAV